MLNVLNLIKKKIYKELEHTKVLSISLFLSWFTLLPMKLWTSFNILDLVCAMMLTMMSRVVQPLHVGYFI